MTKPWKATSQLVLVLILSLSTTVGFAQKKVPAGGIVWNSVAQVYFNPASGTGEVAGYFTYFPGIDDLFAGSPSVATAHFTFRSDAWQLQPLPTQGNLNVTLAGGGVWKIYYNPTPTGDWNNLDSFSHGQVVAVLTHGPKELIGVGAVGTSMFSGDAITTYDFVLNGQTFNLGRIFPDGFTNFSMLSNVPVNNTTNFVVLPYASSAIAKGPEHRPTS
jgi:hypothetical protein